MGNACRIDYSVRALKTSNGGRNKSQSSKTRKSGANLASLSKLFS
jgi:hypothetical protein